MWCKLNPLVGEDKRPYQHWYQCTHYILQTEGSGRCREQQHGQKQLGWRGEGGGGEGRLNLIGGGSIFGVHARVERAVQGLDSGLRCVGHFHSIPFDPSPGSRSLVRPAVDRSSLGHEKRIMYMQCGVAEEESTGITRWLLAEWLAGRPAG